MGFFKFVLLLSRSENVYLRDRLFSTQSLRPVCRDLYSIFSKCPRFMCCFLTGSNCLDSNGFKTDDELVYVPGRWKYSSGINLFRTSQIYVSTKASTMNGMHC